MTMTEGVTLVNAAANLISHTPRFIRIRKLSMSSTGRIPERGGAGLRRISE